MLLLLFVFIIILPDMTHAHLPSFSPESVWPELAREAQKLAQTEPFLTPLAKKILIEACGVSEALCLLLAGKLATPLVTERSLQTLFADIHTQNPELEEMALHDLLAMRMHDPAAKDFVSPFLFCKGFHALQAHRIAHVLWKGQRQHIALHLQSCVSEIFGVDIHPGAMIGAGVMMDHATGIVVGETATVGNGVLFWHGVTLGGKGTRPGDRHPKIGDNVWLGAQCTILGPIKVGDNARIGAGSVVTKDVAPGSTVAGVAAQNVKMA